MSTAMEVYLLATGQEKDLEDSLAVPTHISEMYRNISGRGESA
jgi:hypothetical protein